ncbi:MAG: response regulator [Campylobacterales bacterium]|nr:response regulator [Campylobacterales bacterium]
MSNSINQNREKLGEELIKLSKHVDVLFVEDDESEIEFTYTMLQSYLKSLDVARNGQEGLELYKKKHYDLVITDIVMPVMDGLTMVQEMKKIDPEQHIIITSSYDDSENLLKSIKLGVSSYILKPFKSSNIFSELYTICKNIDDAKTLAEYQFDLEKKMADALFTIKEQNKKLTQQAKQVAMGELLSFIAHQLKQPLNGLGLSKELVLANFQDGTLTEESIKKFDDRVTKQIKFMSESIDELRNLFNPNKKPRKFFLDKAIEKVLEMVSIQILGTGIELRTDLEKNLRFEGFQNELEQVMLNIINNGKEALVERKVEEPVIEIKSFQDDRCYIITIEDNGGGIPDSIIEKVFDSYFTTKGDEGTGIGLNLAKLIVQDSLQGEIAVKNSDKGAFFTIKLPI